MFKLKNLITLLAITLLTTFSSNIHCIYADIANTNNKNSISYIESEDPEYWKYAGKINVDNNINSNETVPLKIQDFSLETTSILTNQVYGHNAKFSNHKIMQGIDVSKWQEVIDWKKVKASGIDFAIIRAGYRSIGKSGNLYEDTYFKKNIVAAAEAGIEHIGVYIFSQAITVEEAIEEADFIINLVKDYDINMPIVIDVEYGYNSDGSIGRLDTSISKKELTDIAEAFCLRVIESGYKPMIYSGKHFLQNNMDGAYLGEKYDIWLANYVSYSTNYENNYDIWQYSSIGTINGIYGNVDSNFWYYKEDSDNISYSISLSETTKTIMSKESFSLTPTITPENKDILISWKSENPTIAYVDKNGNVTAVAKGKTNITATLPNGSVAKCKIIVNEDLSDYTISNISTSYYTGKEITHNITVKSKNKIARTGTVTCTSLNLRTGPGTNYSRVRFLQKGDKFFIYNTIIIDGVNWHAVSYTDSEGILHKGYLCENGTDENYVSVVKTNRVITLNTQYTTNYKNNINIGKATLYVNGKENGTYKGQLIKTFSIVPAATKSLRTKVRSQNYLTIAWNKNTNVDGYYLYRADAYDKTYVKIATLDTNTLFFKDTKVKPDTCYYYKIRAFKKVNGTNYIGATPDALTTYTKTKDYWKASTKSKTYLYEHAGYSYKKLVLIESSVNLEYKSITIDKSGYKWYRVTYTKNGVTYVGFVPGSKVTIYKNGIITASSLKVRSGPSTKHNSLGALKKNTRIYIYKEVDGWYYTKITLNSKTKYGYVKKDYVKIT